MRAGDRAKWVAYVCLLASVILLPVNYIFDQFNTEDTDISILRASAPSTSGLNLVNKTAWNFWEDASRPASPYRYLRTLGLIVRTPLSLNSYFSRNALGKLFGWTNDCNSGRKG